MLDQETKKRIDDLRNILVGKVPDPKSQVEQITISLIYKFMNDMDAESLSMGGVPTFFVGEYKKYSWENIFNPKLGGAGLVALYGEAIEKISLNPNMPKLFRDIFKNAFIPYRDPETLKLFLKTIDEFEYTHSEKLGDAFEYLLSFMGSQGDAGQFRTPRHIIDFIVEIINPTKTESILDPASGSAGFLIAAYKSILKNNTFKILGDALTSSERIQLNENFNGYDISPDMVRLGLVNMYLHNFPDPQIFEYDTLTSQDRWNEYYDVILANPPFMTPKGGIRPHQRFGIQSNRSEILFVDYILEHLKPQGRAGIVVPEGIIFDSDRMYRELRLALLKGGLVGVVSLPAGVFNPYSSVKTSILIIDKELSKKTDKLFFISIENDGFSLGRQRNEIDKNDLPRASEVIKRFVSGDYDHESLITLDRKTVLGDKSHSLNLKNYQNGFESSGASESATKYVSLGDYATLMTGGTPSSKQKTYYEGGTVPWLVSGDIHGGEIYDCEGRITELGLKNSNAKYLPIDSVLIALNGQGKTRGTVALLKFKATCNQSLVSIKPNDETVLHHEFLYLYLKSIYQKIRDITGDKQRSGLNMPLIRAIKIPLPSMNEQLEIINQYKKVNKLIEENQKLIEKYETSIFEKLNSF